MRRVAWLVLTALGTFLFVLALFIRFVVVGDAVKFPLNENQIATLQANNASYFSVAKLAELTGVTMEDTLTVQGDNAAGNSSHAVWNEFSYVYDETNGQAVQYGTQRLAFDRRTGELVNCCGAYIGTHTSLKMSGQGYVWPFNAQKKTYQVFDTTLLKPVSYTYAGTASVDGINTNKYVGAVQATQIGTQTLPGSLVGINDAQSVTLAEYDQSTTTQYVDPNSGAPVRGQSSQHLYLVNASGAPVLTLLNANFSTSAASEASAVKTAKHDDGEIALVSVILPVVFGLVGLILLVMGLVLTLARRGEEYDEYEEEEYETGEVTA
jgi:Porin PorA